MTLKLDTLLSRVTMLAAALLVCAGLLRVITSNFVVRVVADQRTSLSREALIAAAAKYPSSSRINYRLAESDLTEAKDTASAIFHASNAISLSPWDYQPRQFLALAQEMANKPDEAETSMRLAAKLAPSNAELNWKIANVLLRRGKLAESLDYFKAATAANDELLASALDLLWQGSNGNLETVKSLVGNDPERQLTLVKFLIEQSQSAQAILIFNSIEVEARINSPRSGEFIKTLITVAQYESAKSLWLGLVGAPVNSQAVANFWNGSFESEPVKKINQFDWTFNANEFARINIDRSQARSGSRSLKIAFNGIDTTTLKDQVKQLVALKPGGRYRVEFYAKTDDLVIPEGPRVALIGGSGVISSSPAILAGTYDWQLLSFEFVAPQDASPKFISIIRTPKFSYDDPAKGVVWFDDFSLVEK